MKIFIVDKCMNCPNRDIGALGSRCDEMSCREIEDITTIPKWCPLKDWKDEWEV